MPFIALHSCGYSRPAVHSMHNIVLAAAAYFRLAGLQLLVQWAEGFAWECFIIVALQWWFWANSSSSISIAIKNSTSHTIRGDFQISNVIKLWPYISGNTHHNNNNNNIILPHVGFWMRIVQWLQMVLYKRDCNSNHWTTKEGNLT